MRRAARSRGSRARALQVIGAACVASGVFLAVVMWAVLRAPGSTRLGVGIVVVGAVLLAAAAVLRRIRGRRRIG